MKLIPFIYLAIAMLSGAAGHPCLDTLPVDPPCYSSLDDLWCKEWKNTTDTKVNRRYNICPGEHLVGFLDLGSIGDEDPDWIEGTRPFFPKAYAEYVCASDDDTPSTDCIISGGQFSVYSTSGGFVGESVFRGFQFQDVKSTPGAILFQEASIIVSPQSQKSLKFVDCVFSNIEAGLGVFYGFQDTSATPSYTFTFENTVFKDNKGFVTPYVPGMITNNVAQSTMIFDKVIFSNNDYSVPGTASGGFTYAINSGGDIEMTEVCFEDNNFLSRPDIIGANSTGFDLSMVYSSEDTAATCLLLNFESSECVATFDAEYCFDSPPTDPPATDPPATGAPTMHDHDGDGDHDGDEDDDAASALPLFVFWTLAFVGVALM